MNTNSTARVGVFDGAVWVKVEGRGSFQTSGGLKRYCCDMMKNGQRNFIVDLQDCWVMDSTFMGTLAGIALQLRKFGDGRLQVIRANERNTFLLQNLGLDRLFEVKSQGDPDTPVLPNESRLETAGQPYAEKKAAASDVLEAHEALVQAAPENASLFQDVMDYLRQETGGEESGS